MKNFLKSLGILVAAVVAGIAYRMGGSGNFARWIRPFGEGTCSVIVMGLEGLIHWSLILCFGMSWAVTTYFKKKGTDAHWWNWTLVGFVFSMIPLPYCIFTKSHWIGFGIRTIVCTALTPIWNCFLSQYASKLFKVGKDVSDEFGRGFINVATLPLLLIGA